VWSLLIKGGIAMKFRKLAVALGLIVVLFVVSVVPVVACSRTVTQTGVSISGVERQSGTSSWLVTTPTFITPEVMFFGHPHWGRLDVVTVNITWRGEWTGPASDRTRPVSGNGSFSGVSSNPACPGSGGVWR